MFTGFLIPQMGREEIPRTREPGFEPEIIKNRTVIEEGLESQIISMYAKGMSVRDISEHVHTFLEEYDFSGKTIIPFTTHGGSGFSRTIQTISDE